MTMLAVGSDYAALEAAALALGKTAPDAEALVMSQGVLQALVTHLATQADLLGLAGGTTLLGEEGLGIRLRAQRAVLPLVGGRRRQRLGFECDWRIGNHAQMRSGA